MKLKSKIASSVAAMMAAGAALLSFAGPASAANPPYADCPNWALCLYQDAAGAGSKAILVPPAAGSGSSTIWTLYSTHFLNGALANNQVSSYLNNSNCSVTMWDTESTGTQLSSAPANLWGFTQDFNGQFANDRLSALRFYCP